MSAMSDRASAGRPRAPAPREPSDLIPASDAAKLAGVVAKTLARWAANGHLTAYHRPHLKKSAPLYSRAAVLALRAVSS